MPESALGRRWLLIILAVSVLVRLAAALYLGNQVVNVPGAADQLSYNHMALRLLGGHGFTVGEDWWPATQAGEPTAHWSYLYSLLLAGLYALSGSQPLFARLVQAAIVGILHPWLAYLLGRRLGGENAGLIGAVLTAGYAYFIYYSATLMTEPLYITGILACLEVAARLADQLRAGKFTWSGYALLGVLLGLVILLRQLFMLFAPFLLLWIAWVALRSRQQGSLRRSLAGMVLSVGIIGAMILPFTIYNYQRFERFILLNTNSGFAFYWGNHPIHGTQFIPILPSDTYMRIIPRELFVLDEAAMDEELLRRGMQFVFDDPLRYAQLSFSRLPWYFDFFPEDASSTISQVTRMVSFGLLWPFMLGGLLLAIWRGGRNILDGAATPAFLLTLFGLVYTGIHVLTWTLVRYRLPVDAVMLPFAAMAILAILQRFGWLKSLQQHGWLVKEPA